MRSLLRSIRQFLSELRRRNVYRVAVTYAAVGFVVIEAADLVFPRIDLPPWTVTLVIALVGLGFPIALVLAWALEVTPEGVRVEESEGSEEVVPAGSPRDLWVGASVLVLLLLGVWWLWGGLGGGEAADQAERRAPEIEDRSIAVLPFEVSGSGAEEWRDGMVTALSLNLDGAAGLRAIPDRRVFAAAGQVDSARAVVTESPALSVAREVGAKYALVGSAVQLGTELRLGAEVHETTSKTRLGQVEVRGPPDSITALTNRLTRKVLGVLLEKSEDQVPSVDLASITTSSLEALKAFLEGERHYRAGKYDEATDDFEAAVAMDSTFALAYVRLADANGWLGNRERTDQHWRRAYERSGQLPARERRIVEAKYLRDVQGRSLAATDRFRRLADAYPDDPAVWYRLGEALFHDFVPRGWPEAETAFQRAVQLDPGFVPYHRHLVQIAFSVRHDSALAARRIQAHPPGEIKQAFRRAHKLFFGTQEAQKSVLAWVDSSGAPAPVLVPTLFSPRDRGLQEKVLRQLLTREDLESSGNATLLIANNLEQGQVKAAAARLNELKLGPTPVVDVPACYLAGEMSLGTVLPDSVLRPYLEPSQIGEEARARRLTCAGFYLLERGREEELPSLTSRLREAGAKRDVPEPQMQQLIDELKGYRAFKAGDLKRAERLWGGYNESAYWGAIWRGDLYRELGELKKAEGWYLAGWPHPITHERLGRLYEKMGRPEEGRAAYERFIEAWKDADPELQARVEKARKRLEALGEDKRTE